MEKFVDYYTLLNILPTANDELIKRAYRIMSKEMHPDQGGDERQFILLTEAYEMLSNPIKRKAYDQEYVRFQQVREQTKEQSHEKREKSNHHNKTNVDKDYPKFSFDYKRYGKVTLGALVGLIILAKAINAFEDTTEPEIPSSPIIFPVEESGQSIEEAASIEESQDLPNSVVEADVGTVEPYDDQSSEMESNEEVINEKEDPEFVSIVPSDHLTADSSSLYTRYLDRIYKLEDDLLTYGEVWEFGSDAEITQASYIQLKAWDDLLNEIYQTLKLELTEEEFFALRDLQRTWIVERDAISAAAAADFTGGSWEVPVFNDAQLEVTRQRCYWLVTNYMN
ncbi:DnaJ domain-containing protein [Planococcus sp. FY231025]|uniref:DnaJ domain-containing protein n=1 Tax=Planococcus sp. FY231025 TaxID=3455699 RepID=UPI003F90749C